MKVFLDTNIILDLIIADRKNSLFALKIFEAGKKGQISLFTSVIAITDSLYVLKSTYLVQHPEKQLGVLMDVLKVIPTSHKSLVQALASSFTDKEDAIQYFTAKEVQNLKMIITGDKSGYKLSSIKIISPRTFVEDYLN